MKRISILALLPAVALAQNAVIRTGTNAAVDLSGATATQPARKGTGAPSGACVQGEQYFRTDATAGQNLYFCTSTNNWTQMTGGGGASNPTGTTDPATCAAGELFFNTTVGTQKVCSANNIWSPLREVVPGSGINAANSGSTEVLSIDTAVITSQATAQAGTPWWCAPVGGSPTAYTCAPTPSVTSLANGSFWLFKSDILNSANATLAIGSVAAKNLKKLVNGALANVAANDLDPDGGAYWVTYDSTADAFVVQEKQNIAAEILTLTNKTYDAEATGNTLTTTSKIWLPAAACQNATATLTWDTPTSNPAVAACITGTNTQKGVADFADSASLSMQLTLMLPSDFTGTMDARFKWLTSATTGSVVWQMATICVADAETDDPAFNTASTVVDAAKGTTLQTNDATITGVTITGCAAGELMHVKVLRDAAHASDDLAATARLIGVELTTRRAQ